MSLIPFGILAVFVLVGVVLLLVLMRRANTRQLQPVPLTCRLCGASLEYEVVSYGPGNTLLVDRLCNACIDPPLGTYAKEKTK